VRFGEVGRLGEVIIEVVQFPLCFAVVVIFEVAGHRLPPVGPQRSVAEHLEVLDPTHRRRIGIGEGVGEALPVDRHLGDASVVVRRVHAGDLVDRRRDVGDVMELLENGAWA